MKIDLHLHTKLSDGSLGIEDIILQARRTDIDFISITDHDTLAANSRAAFLGKRYGVEVIPGVELSAFDKSRGRKVHILCYAMGRPERLEGLCLKSCEIRRQCGKEMIEKVMKLYPLTPENILRYSTSSNSVFKQHIMHALIDYGYALEFYGELNHKLFNRKDGICYVQRDYPDVNFVLDLIHSAKGVAVMAHPAYYDSFDLLEELAEKGKLDGVELGHYSAADVQKQSVKDIAEKYNLIVTGGSDFHGLYNEKPTYIAAETTSEEELNKLLKKSGDLCLKKSKILATATSPA
ncbi:MAG: PHP domain-containing protein [Ruminococcus sp.]|jgi:predicted metal-dependent phosphoesterase TrpH|nr:PHP domain-containing protein [Ruminococcus sp.]